MRQYFSRFKMLKTASIAAIAILLLWLASCEKEVHINLSGEPPRLVVEGQIETGLPPYVTLTNTVSFFSTIDLSTLQNAFIHGANITVSDGSQTVTLKEYSVDTGAASKFFFYSVDTTVGNFMVGQVNKYYTLTINYNGQTYTSTTKIPFPKAVDTMWYDKPEFNDPKLLDSAKELFVNYSDPDTIGNYVRYFTSRNGDLFYPGPSIYSDQVINGTTVKQIGILAGFNPEVNLNTDSMRYFYPGDTVTLKWCMIDKGVYTFWNTYQFAQQSTGNPFASPINVTSNISNGALGVWAGYASTFRTLVIH